MLRALGSHSNKSHLQSISGKLIIGKLLIICSQIAIKTNIVHTPTDILVHITYSPSPSLLWLCHSVINVQNHNKSSRLQWSWMHTTTLSGSQRVITSAAWEEKRVGGGYSQAQKCSGTKYINKLDHSILEIGTSSSCHTYLGRGEWFSCPSQVVPRAYHMQMQTVGEEECKHKRTEFEACNLQTKSLVVTPQSHVVIKILQSHEFCGHI